MKTTTALTFLSLALLCVSASHADTFGTGGNTFDIDFVNIGNPGNAADTTGHPSTAGSVAETYRIGKYQISRDLISKANLEGQLGVTLIDMTSYGGNGVDKPATGLSWYGAAKFVNWLNTSTGNSPAYKFSGSFQLWSPSDPGYNAVNPFRNSLAKYFLPSLNEWYKAAYYDPNLEVYYDYPTGSNTSPSPVVSGTGAGTAVYGQSLSQGPADVTQTGGLSPFGTMGQGSNVFEWIETEFDLLNDSISSDRGLRGGNWSDNASRLSSSFWNSASPPDGFFFVGFRVASIPGLPGDYNHNGIVDAADYTVYRNTLGQAGTDLAADGNGNGSIDIGDYSVWRAHFGQTNGSGSGADANTAVPEPATLVMLMLVAVGAYLWRYRAAEKVPLSR